MDQLFNQVGLYLSIFGIIAAFGGAAGYFKASRGASIIKMLETENAGLRRQLLDREVEIKTREAKLAAQAETITELQKSNEYLKELGQGSPQLIELTKAVKQQNKIFTKYFKKEKAK